jgi:hypothetical protein
MGSKFAPVAGSNAVTQFDKGSNVKFRANKLRNRLALLSTVAMVAHMGTDALAEHGYTMQIMFFIGVPSFSVQ